MIKRLLSVLILLSFVAFPNVARAAAMPTCASGDPVVWVNTSSHVYHLQGDPYYGKTKAGDYECESKAVAGGARAPKSSSTKAPKVKSTPMSAAPAATVAPDAAASASPAPAKKKKKKKSAAPSPSPSP